MHGGTRKEASKAAAKAKATRRRAERRASEQGRPARRQARRPKGGARGHKPRAHERTCTQAAPYGQNGNGLPSLTVAPRGWVPRATWSFQRRFPRQRATANRTPCRPTCAPQTSTRRHAPSGPQQPRQDDKGAQRRREEAGQEEGERRQQEERNHSISQTRVGQNSPPHLCMFQRTVANLGRHLWPASWPRT